MEFINDSFLYFIISINGYLEKSYKNLPLDAQNRYKENLVLQVRIVIDQGKVTKSFQQPQLFFEESLLYL